MAETRAEYDARIAERQRVDAFMSQAKQKQRTAPIVLTPEQIAAQKAALLRQQMMQQVAPQPVQTGLQSLLNVLSGKPIQRPQPQPQQRRGY